MTQYKIKFFLISLGIFFLSCGEKKIFDIDAIHEPHGRLAMESGEPAQDAVVEIFEDSNSIFKTTTDKNGVYRLNELDTGTYVLNASVRDGESVLNLYKKFDFSGNIDLGTDTLFKPGSISLQLEAGGEPAAGAQCRIEKIDYSATANGSGTCLLANVPRGKWNVNVSLEFYQSAVEKNIGVKAGDTAIAKISLVQDPNAKPHGRLVLEDGSPAKSAVVEISNDSILIQNLLVDEEGVYRLNNLDSGTYFLGARLNHNKGVLKVYRKFQFSGIFYIGTDTLFKPGHISLELDAGGEPAAGAQCKIEEIKYSATADDSGICLFANLPRGKWNVNASLEFYKNTVAKAIAVKAGETAFAHISMVQSPNARPHGRLVLEDGSPAKNAAVEISEDSKSIEETSTDATGLYRLAGLDSGSYVLTARIDKNENQLNLYRKFDYSGTFNLGTDSLLKPGSISLRLKAGGEPAAGAQCRIEEINYSAGADDSGICWFANVPRGIWDVSVSLEFYERVVVKAMAIKAGDTAIAKISMTQDPDGNPHGRLVLEDGSPAKNAVVEISNDSTSIEETSTDTAGVYRLSGLDSGSYVLAARIGKKENPLNLHRKFDFSGNTHLGTDTLLKPGYLSLQLEAGGEPAAGAQCRIDEINYTATANDSGICLFANVPRGKWDVIASLEFYKNTVAKSVAVIAGDTAIAKLSMVQSPNARPHGRLVLEDGSPAKNAVIEIFNDSKLIENTLSDKNGVYRLNHLDLGAYFLNARLNRNKGVLKVYRKFDFTGTFYLGRDSLLNPGNIALQLEAGGEPAAGAQCRIAAINYSATAGDFGTCRFSNVPRGKWNVNYSLEFYRSGVEKAIAVKAGDTAIVKISMVQDPNARPHGRLVLEDGSPVKNAMVEISNDSMLIENTLTDEKGVYRLNKLDSGAYFLSASFKGNGGVIKVYREFDFSGTFYLGRDSLLKPGKITLQLEADGQPALGAACRIEKLNFSTAAGDSGICSFVDVPRGKWDVHCNLKLYLDTVVQDIKVLSGRTAAAGKIVLAPNPHTDKEPPKIGLLAPRLDTIITDSTFELEFTITDLTGISAATLNLDTLSEIDGLYKAEVSLKPGENLFIVTAADRATSPNTAKDSLIIWYNNGNQLPVFYNELPENYQFYPRDANDSAEIKLSGIVKYNTFNGVRVAVHSDGKLFKIEEMALKYLNNEAAFSLRIQVPSDTVNYRLDVVYFNGAEYYYDKIIHSIVCGDVFLINGQSNANAVDFNNIMNYQNPWLRTYDKNQWGLARGKNSDSNMSIGVWGFELGDSLVKNFATPVAIINSALSGAGILAFLPGAGSYEGLLNYLNEAGVRKSIKALFWFQGESDAMDSSLSSQYENRFDILYNAWKADYPGIEKYFVVQIEYCVESYVSLVREIQRSFSGKYPDVRLMSTVGVNQKIDGCHFSSYGFKTIGGNLYRSVAVEMYGASFPFEVYPPNILTAVLHSDSASIDLIFDQHILLENDTLVGGEIRRLIDYIYLDGQAGLISTLSSHQDTLTLALTTPAHVTNVTYLPRKYYNNSSIPYQGPWIRNNGGLGALSFFEFKVGP